MGSTLRLRLRAPVTDEQVRRLCAALAGRLRTGTVHAVVCRVERGASDLATVDAVARLALVARRAGVTLRLDRPCVELSALVDLVGLRALLERSDDR